MLCRSMCNAEVLSLTRIRLRHLIYAFGIAHSALFDLILVFCSSARPRALSCLIESLRVCRPWQEAAGVPGKSAIEVGGGLVPIIQVIFTKAR